MRVSGFGISTSRSSSSARTRASAGPISKCVRRVSTIWKPMVKTGFSAVIGSWKIIAISLPRMRRSLCAGIPMSSRSPITAEPRARPFGGSRPMSAIDDCVLPEPDSPTIARTSPGRTS